MKLSIDLLALILVTVVAKSFSFQLDTPTARKQTNLFVSATASGPLPSMNSQNIRNFVTRCIHHDYSLGVEDTCSLVEMETIMNKLQNQREFLTQRLRELDLLEEQLETTSLQGSTDQYSI